MSKLVNASALRHKSFHIMRLQIWLPCFSWHCVRHLCMLRESLQMAACREGAEAQKKFGLTVFHRQESRTQSGSAEDAVFQFRHRISDKYAWPSAAHGQAPFHQGLGKKRTARLLTSTISRCRGAGSGAEAHERKRRSRSLQATCLPLHLGSLGASFPRISTRRFHICLC